MDSAISGPPVVSRPAKTFTCNLARQSRARNARTRSARENTPDQGLLLRNRQTSWKPGMRRGIERGRSEHYVVPSQRDEQDAVTRDEIQPLGGACEGMQVLDARSSTLVCRQDQVNNFNKSDTRLPSFGLVTSNGAVTRRDSDCNSSLGKTT